jgi:hypothetical protein
MALTPDPLAMPIGSRLTYGIVVYGENGTYLWNTPIDLRVDGTANDLHEGGSPDKKLIDSEFRTADE